MRKALTTMVLCLIALLDSYAGYDDKGYAGKVGISISPEYDLGWMMDITTSHGYSFGNGFWLGGGIGVSFYGKENEGMSIPIFAHAQYNLQMDKLSPYVSCKFGYNTISFFDKGLRFIRPEIGVNIGQWDIFAAYSVGQYAISNYASVGCAWNF